MIGSKIEKIILMPDQASNLESSGPKPDVLPIIPPGIIAATGGIEPPTNRLTAGHSGH